MDPSEIRFYNPFDDLVESHNRLPHFQQIQATYFITFRLADSLPEELLSKWKEARKLWLTSNPKPWTPSQESEYHKKFSSTIERWLDRGYGSCTLKDPAYQKIVAGALQYHDQTLCHHFAWIIMPNHVHTLTAFIGDWSPDKALHSWKRNSSLEIGRQLVKRSSIFWQKDYYDRLIRDRNHFANCIRYIRRNPEHARLPDHAYSLQECAEMNGLN